MYDKQELTLGREKADAPQKQSRQGRHRWGGSASLHARSAGALGIFHLPLLMRSAQYDLVSTVLTELSALSHLHRRIRWGTRQTGMGFIRKLYAQ